MFYDQLKYLCESHNMTVTAFLKEKLNLSTGKGTAWKNGSIPKYEILQKISKYFNVPVSYLFQDDTHYIEKHNEYVVKATQTNSIGDNVINNANFPEDTSAQVNDEMTAELVKRFSNLSFDEKLNVFDYIKNIK